MKIKSLGRNKWYVFEGNDIRQGPFPSESEARLFVRATTNREKELEQRAMAAQAEVIKDSL